MGIVEMIESTLADIDPRVLHGAVFALGFWLAFWFGRRMFRRR